MPPQRGLGLGDGGLERAKLANAVRATRLLKEAAVKLDDLPDGEIPYQARRRYNSSSSAARARLLS
jgi:hypothetical protein